MRNLFTFAILMTLFSCGSINRSLFGTTEKTLINTVSIEQDCPIDKIEVLQSNKGMHGATYSLSVCGKRMVYKQVGSVFMEASKADETIKKLSNK